MSGSGKAFIRGGIGCLSVFVAIVISVYLAAGGGFRVNVNGLLGLAMVFFLPGGIIGLVIYWIYDLGRQHGLREQPPPPPQGGASTFDANSGAPTTSEPPVEEHGDWDDDLFERPKRDDREDQPPPYSS